MLGCTNIENTLQFYQQALHFVIVRQRKSDNGPEWVYLKSGQTSLMLESSQSHTPGETGNSRLFFYTDDASALHHFLNARGYATSPLKTTPYNMQEFNISDPEGHYLTIGQQL